MSDLSARRVGRPATPAMRSAYYERLMSVSFRHSYYNRSGDACTDLNVRPTVHAQRLMQSLGLLFRNERAGFSVLYDKGRKEALFDYLRRPSETYRGEFWSRLSFVLTSQKPCFINITDIPIDLDPRVRNFYFTNQTAHLARGDDAFLNPGSRVTGKDLLPIVPAQYPVALRQGDLGVAARAISGEVVLCEPRCVPDPRPDDLVLDCAERLAEMDHVAGKNCRDVIYLDFSALPQDKYSIEYVTGPSGGDTFETCLYTNEAPIPLAFIDLLFSAPNPFARGLYPVKGLAGPEPATVDPVAYVLNFEARATFWNYYIVPQAQRGSFHHLSIESLPPGRPIRFAGPGRVKLPNGATAYRFTSMRPMRLHQQSPFRLRLRGRRSERSIEDDVLIDRLPVAGDQVTPLTSAMARLALVTSLCPGEENQSDCSNLIQQVFGGARIGVEAAADNFSRLRDADGTGARSPPQARGAAARPRGYSDIYVYV